MFGLFRIGIQLSCGLRVHRIFQIDIEYHFQHHLDSSESAVHGTINGKHTSTAYNVNKTGKGR
jgi:hypothetical protein